MAGLKLFIALFVAAVAVGGKSVEAQVHHVVGGDPSDIGTWSTGRVFKVGDHIWFNYSAEHGGMVELKNMEEYLSCDVSNPIKMYTDKVTLEEEGIRYFASGNLESCKNGLKVHVVVPPPPKVPLPPPNAPPLPPKAPLPPPKAPLPPPKAPLPPPNAPPLPPKAPPPPPNAPPLPPNAPPPPPKAPPPPPKAPPPPNAPPPPPNPPPPASSAPTYLSGLPYMFGGLLLCLMGL